MTQKNATKIRDRFLTEHAQYYVEKNKHTFPTHHDPNKNAEKSKRTFKRIRYQIGEQFLPLDHILIPSSDGQWERINNDDEIFTKIINENQKVMIAVNE